MIYRIAVGLLITLSWISCTPKDEILLTEAVNLQFSTDTVFFDTLFTDELSITRRLKVYNPEDKAVLIDEVRLSEGQSSPYSLKINGQEGKNFGSLQLLGGDSLLILLEAKLPVTTEAEPYLAEDAVVTINKGLSQQVPIIGYGQNAERIYTSDLECNTTWSSTIPYVVEGTVRVLPSCLLTIDKGTRIYFKPGSSLQIAGTLIAEGDSALSDQIIFRNFRLDPAYDQPGQWRGLNFLVGTKENFLKYCQIRNAIIGIQLGSPDEDAIPEITLENCQLINHYTAGILAFGSDLKATNTLVANCLGPAVAGLAGGNYEYIHCTFANYFRGSVSRELPTAFFADIYQVQDENGEVLTFADNLDLTMQNSIVWGNLFEGEEWAFDFSGGQTIFLGINNNLLRTTQELLVTDNKTSIQRDFPQFTDTGDLNFTPDETSPARDTGLLLGIEKDLIGAKRDAQPDIGALEYLPPPEDQ